MTTDLPQVTNSETAPPIHYAGFWIRVCAESIDSTFLTLVAWLLEIILLGVFHWFRKKFSAEAVPEFSDAYNAFFLQMFNMGLYLVLSFPYYVYGQLRWGTTLGKKPFRVYVVDAKSIGPLTLKQSLVRFFGYGVSTILMMTGFLMAAFHPQKRALHDLMAGTVSIIKPKKSVA